jgi:hypothetical protein
MSRSLNLLIVEIVHNIIDADFYVCEGNEIDQKISDKKPLINIIPVEPSPVERKEIRDQSKIQKKKEDEIYVTFFV